MTTKLSPLAVSEISTFATRHSIPVAQAYTLPTIFEKIAEVSGQSVRAIISQATYTNQGLADYVKELSAQVA